MGDENYDSTPLDHEDQFGHPINCRYRWVMRDGQSTKDMIQVNLGTMIGVDRSLGRIKMRILIVQEKTILRCI